MRALTAGGVTANPGARLATGAAPPTAPASPGAAPDPTAAPDPSAATLTHALFVYRNDPCVVIGRHQNPWTECDLASMARDGVPLVRRISGGGAVYHDPGNLNFCFLGDQESYELDRHFAVVTEALAGLGIRAHRNERNDILLDGVVNPRATKPGRSDTRPGGTEPRGATPALPAKISGNAFRHTKNVSMHHGTLLVDADLDRLSAYLHSPTSPDTPPPPAAKAEVGAAGQANSTQAAVTSSKAIASVRSSVANLNDVNPALSFDDVADALAAAYRDTFAGAGTATAPAFATAVSADARLAEYDEELRSWEWRYGKTPAFTFQAAPSDAAAGPSLSFEVRSGRVVSVEPVGEALAAGNLTGTLSTTFDGVRFRRADLLEAARSLPREARDLVQAVADALPEVP